jgi:hypothetical protein
VDLAIFAKKWNKNSGKKGLSYPGQKNRMCYYCVEGNQFTDKCLYKNIEDKQNYERGEMKRYKKNKRR